MIREVKIKDPIYIYKLVLTENAISWKPIFSSFFFFKQYVLKRINLKHASVRERKSAEQEAKLLSKLKHPNIVSYKDSFESSEGLLYIAMQYCEGGDLYTRLKEQKGNPLEERQVVEWFVQIAMALQVRQTCAVIVEWSTSSALIEQVTYCLLGDSEKGKE